MKELSALRRALERSRPHKHRDAVDVFIATWCGIASILTLMICAALFAFYTPPLQVTLFILGAFCYGIYRPYALLKGKEKSRHIAPVLYTTSLLISSLVLTLCLVVLCFFPIPSLTPYIAICLSFLTLFCTKAGWAIALFIKRLGKHKYSGDEIYDLFEDIIALSHGWALWPKCQLIVTLHRDQTPFGRVLWQAKVVNRENPEETTEIECISRIHVVPPDVFGKHNFPDTPLMHLVIHTDLAHKSAHDKMGIRAQAADLEPDP